MTKEEKAKVKINVHGLLILQYENPSGMRNFTEKERIICEFALKNYWKGKADQQNKDLSKEVEEERKTLEVINDSYAKRKAKYKEEITYLKKQLEERTLLSKCFDLANELAMAGFGDDAVKLHKVHNKLLNT